MGMLPAIAPLANAYVPYQTDNPEQYDASLGLVRGTLYPGLDLPFMGLRNKKALPQTPMAELQALGFAVQELALYLDTHRDDEDAQELYCQYQTMYQKANSEFNEKHGPVSHTDIQRSGYAWLDDPWPWEFCNNREG